VQARLALLPVVCQGLLVQAVHHGLLLGLGVKQGQVQQVQAHELLQVPLVLALERALALEQVLELGQVLQLAQLVLALEPLVQLVLLEDHLPHPLPPHLSAVSRLDPLVPP
jgi:hypothetical protein